MQGSQSVRKFVRRERSLDRRKEEGLLGWKEGWKLVKKGFCAEGRKEGSL